MSFADLAYEILSLYISPSEIPSAHLKDLVGRSYSTFRSNHVTPLVHLDGNHYLLELFHGPTFAFKDVALQFVGNLFEYFLVRKNEGKTGRGTSCFRLCHPPPADSDADSDSDADADADADSDAWESSVVALAYLFISQSIIL